MQEANATSLGTLLLTIIERHLKPEAFDWLVEKGKLIRVEPKTSALNASFAAVPRKTGRAVIEISDNELKRIDRLYNGFTINGWAIDKVARLWILLQVDDADKDFYISRIEGLFRDAEMNELATLYAALPIFSYPEAWHFRTTEGIRSNIGTVLESIMYENPYPYKQLPEPSWNQLVLKAFFTDKDITRIAGLDERSNKALASILIDYAHERQAAHRQVNPQLWRLVSKFIDEDTLSDIEKLFDDAHIMMRRAAMLACYYSDYEPSKRLLEKEPAILQTIKSNQLNWNSL